MQFLRIYTGSDGRSHFEELDQSQGASEFMKTHAAKALVFKNDFARDDLQGWHNAPRRQWCITLAGSVDIRVGDGSVKTFGRGDVFLAEDLTGEGHTASAINWIRAFIHVD